MRGRAAWRVARRAALAVAGGLLLVVGHPPYGVGAAGAVALVPLLLLARDVGAGERPLRDGAGWGLLAGVVLFAPLLWWIGRFGTLPLVALVTVQSMAVAAFVGLLAAWGTRPWRPVVAVVLWVGLEVLRSRVPLSGFPWGALGLTQHDGGLFLPVARLATVSGVSAALAAAAVAVEGVVVRLSAGGPGRWRQALRPLAGLAAVLVATGLAGLVPPPAPTGETVDIAGVQGYTQALPSVLDREDVARVESVVEGQVAATRRLAASPAGPPEVTVWPENSLDADYRRVPALAAAVEETLDLLGGGVLLTGALLEATDDPDQLVNAILDIREGGRLAGIHEKRVLVPFGEYVPLRPLFGWVEALEVITRDQVPGAEPTVFEVAGARIAPVACFESIFSGLVRDQVLGGAEVLVVSTNNSSFGRSAASAQHLAFSRLRAVESGRWVLHAGISGISGVVAPDGTLTQETELFTEAVVRADLPQVRGLTPATRFGDVIGTAALLGTLLVIAVLVLDRRRVVEWRPEAPATTLAPAPPGAPRSRHLAAQDTGLSSRRRGFESRREHRRTSSPGPSRAHRAARSVRRCAAG